MKVALAIGVYGKDWEVDLTEEVKAEITKASANPWFHRGEKP